MADTRQADPLEALRNDPAVIAASPDARGWLLAMLSRDDEESQPGEQPELTEVN